MGYTVLVHPAEEGGFWSEVPEHPGCRSQGETIEEVLSNSREAIEAHLMALQEDLHDLSVIADRKGDRCISFLHDRGRERSPSKRARSYEYIGNLSAISRRFIGNAG